MFASSLRSLTWLPRRQQHRSRPAFRNRLLVETLEDRTVPSVTVGQNGDTLKITDTDNGGHAITVNQTATQGTFTVQVDSGGASTFLGVNNIKVDLGADSATLLFNGGDYPTNLAGNLAVTAADGNNSVDEAFSTILGNASVTEGNGSDTVLRAMRRSSPFNRP